MRLLAELSFEVEVMVEQTHESLRGRLVFIARKPGVAHAEPTARAADTGFHLVPIGTVRGGRAEPVDDGWASEVCTIELDIKPWMREFDAQGDTQQPPWSVELMRQCD